MHIPPENWTLLQTIEAYQNSSRVLRWEELVNLVLGIFEYHPQFGRWFQEPLGPLARQLHETCLEERSLAYIMDRLYRYHAEAVGKKVSVWGDKTPVNVYSLSQIISIFPNAKFVHLLRNGLDAVASMLIQGKMVDHDLTIAAKRWRTSVICARQFARAHPAACIEIRYEDLVAEPSRTVGLICVFLKIPFSDQMLADLHHVPAMRDIALEPHLQRAGHPIDQESVGKGFKSLTHNQKEQLIKLIGRDLIDFGYSDVLQHVAPSVKASLRYSKRGFDHR